MYKITLFSFLAVALAVILGCSGPSNTPQTAVPTDFTHGQLDSIGKAYSPVVGTYGGVLNIPLGADPDGFCPVLTNSGYSMTVLGFIYEGLVTIDPATFAYKPNLAQSWEVSDDGLTWTFYLRDSLFFSDSVQLTSKDVLFSFNEVIYNDKLNSPLNQNFRVEGKKIAVTAIDSLTVQFKLPSAFAPFLSIVGASIMPQHLYGKEAQKGTLQSYLGSGTDPKRIVGTGPFVVQTIAMGRQITLVRNANYWKKDSEGNRLPYLDKVQLHIIKEPNQQFQRFKMGEIDQIMVEAEHYPLLKPLEKQGGFTLYRVGPRWFERFFTFNQNNQVDEKGTPFLSPIKQQWFRSKEFRQATAYAINYGDLIDNVYNGLATQSTGVWGIHKGFFHNPKARSYGFDPIKADSLLTTIGMIDRDGDGIREDSLGNKIAFSITTTAGVQKLQKIYEQVRKDLENIGFEVTMDYVEFNTMIARTMGTFDWDAVGYALGGIRDPHFGKSSVIPHSFRYVINPLREDSEGTAIPKIDRPWEDRIEYIFEAAVQEMDSTKRKALYDEWQAIEGEQSSVIYLPNQEVILGVQNRFGNVQLTGTLGSLESILHNIDEIFILKSRVE